VVSGRFFGGLLMLVWLGFVRGVFYVLLVWFFFNSG